MAQCSTCVYSLFILLTAHVDVSDAGGRRLGDDDQSMIDFFPGEIVHVIAAERIVAHFTKNRRTSAQTGSADRLKMGL